MPNKMLPRQDHAPTVQTIRDRGVTYESRRVDCGKDNCRQCNRESGRYASHGPYWYLCYTKKGKTCRIYLGKTLDTSRFRTESGHVDQEALAAARARKRPPAPPLQPMPSGPGLLDSDSPQPTHMLTRGRNIARRITSALFPREETQS